MSLCYDFEKWTMISLASVAIVLIVGPVTLVAYGANSLEELKNQVITEIKYRTELIRYTIDHGMENKYGSPLEEKNTIELESLVKEHIGQCMHNMTPSTGHC